MKILIKNIIVLSLILLVGCNDDFMDKFPQHTISPEAFFNSVADLELYTNTYYDQVSPQFCDWVSDNCASFSDTHLHNNLIRNNITPATVGGWNDWGTLRRFNFFLENVHKAKGEQDQINHHIGLTRLHRAIWYYDLVKVYNDVPWYSKPLSDTDEELLYKERDPRTMVVDSIMADLDFAVNNISKNMGNRTQFNRWYALAMQARICLHEGTFRKYHEELNLQNTANVYLDKAVAATQKIIESGLFAIDKNGGKDKAYWNLFAGYDLTKSPEIILFKDFDRGANLVHGGGATTFNWVTNLSKSLMESYEYLTEEGKALPYSKIKDYDKKSFTEVFKNRDPRFKQTFMYPGYNIEGNSAHRPNMNLGGYPQIKFMPGTNDQVFNPSSYTDLPVCRYAEVLLINAEAKAELGVLSQSDLDKTLNEIRSRVEMPPIKIGQMEDDPQLQEQFPSISDRILLEIRRERRIELVSENFRWDDLMRWKAGHLIEQVQQGIYVGEFGVFDVTGDGIPEVGIFKNETSNSIPLEERENYTFYYIEATDGSPNTFRLSNTGHIVINGEIGSRTFKQPQYYYLPIPLMQITLNPNLSQTIYWEE